MQPTTFGLSMGFCHFTRAWGTPSYSPTHLNLPRLLHLGRQPADHKLFVQMIACHALRCPVRPHSPHQVSLRRLRILQPPRAYHDKNRWCGGWCHCMDCDTICAAIRTQYPPACTSAAGQPRCHVLCAEQPVLCGCECVRTRWRCWRWLETITPTRAWRTSMAPLEALLTCGSHDNSWLMRAACDGRRFFNHASGSYCR